MHQDTGWRSLGSFTASGPRLLLFNDPHCPRAIGIYTWELRTRDLILEVVTDQCAGGLHASSLTHLPWSSRQPPSPETAASRHWAAPEGCPPGNPAPPAPY